MASRPITAKTAWYDFVLDGIEASEVTYANDVLTVMDHQGKTAKRLAARDIAGVDIEEGPLRNGLTITPKRGQAVKIAGLQKKESEQIRRALEGRIRQLQAEEERKLNQEAAVKAKEIKPEIISLDKHLELVFNGQKFIRQSEATELADFIRKFTARLDARARGQLDQAGKAALVRIDKLGNPQGLESARTGANLKFTSSQAAPVKETAADFMDNPLTDEQAKAVATDEDATLVLAGAGTGKTSVITGKIAHLIRNQGVAPGSILALAFNREAAREIRERLPDDLRGAQVSTFHSFAFRLLGEATGQAPSVSKLATDDIAYQQAIDGILTELMGQREYAGAVIALLTSEYAAYLEPFQFGTEKGYREYVRDTDPRTLNGELVKSMEELAIANFLASNGVAYVYERDYQFPTATPERRQYQPDFYLTGHDVYIEHFALDERGNPPEGWTGYAEGVTWKRGVHERYQTSLMETYSWERRQGVLLQNLKEKLTQRGIKLEPVPVEQLVRKLSQTRIRRLAGLIGTFLNHAKSGNMPESEIREAARNHGDSSRTEHFLDVFFEIRRRYELLLQAEGARDFHDLINEAAEQVRRGGWNSPFRYVLIDEFQDISNGRMNLAKVLRKPGAAYFLVGDDWQSIYRFAGSYVGLIHQCDRFLGHTERVNLTRTFRFGEGIARPSTGFIQKNPEQTRRDLLTLNKTGDCGIMVIAHDNPAEGVKQALWAIEQARESETETIKVLGRYRNSVRSLADRTRRRDLRVDYATVHSTKGLEADHVIVVDLKDDRRYGFPSQMVDDPLLTIVMPPTHGDPYPFAEERRLFYVALTRARKGAYLVTDPNMPSAFVRELTRDYPEIGQQGAIQPKCPDCSSGSMIQSQTGDNLRCTNYPVCRHMWPRCPGCRRGYASVNEEGTETACTNDECPSPSEVCPGCRKGVLILKQGRTQFWGCSRYWDEPSCNYARTAMSTS